MLLIKLNDTIELKIEKLTPTGEGLARFGEEKFVVFVIGALPEEKIKAKITFLNKHFAHAQIVEIIEQSKFRTKPICPLYNACGSCNLGNVEYDYLIEQKTSILKELFCDLIDEKNIFDVIKSPQIQEYRHKIQYPCRQTKNSKRILMGYFKTNSHDLTNIKFCPLQPSFIAEITQYLRDNFEFDCYDEKRDKGLLKNVLYRVSNYSKDTFLTFVLNCDEKNYKKYYEDKFLAFSKKLSLKYPNIIGIFANLNNKKTNKITSDLTLKIFGEDCLIETLENEIQTKKYKISADSFFQVNPKSAVELFEIVRKNIKEKSSVLDAYGGVGAIGIWVSDKANKITLVEENSSACVMAKENFKLNNIENFEIFSGDATKHFENFKKENKIFDYIILDPPRSGCEEKGLKDIAPLAKNIIYVSCNPMTLKRDIKTLINCGFKPEFLQGVDMFPYTNHIESVVLFTKK